MRRICNRAPQRRIQCYNLSMTSHNARQVTRQPQRSVKRAANGRAVSSGTRRRRMLEWMRGRNGPVAGTELARHFRVSRQCVLQDIAILRAERNEILSTPQGYRLPAEQAPDAHRAIIACQHGPQRTEEELQVFGDNAVRVLRALKWHAL